MKGSWAAAVPVWVLAAIAGTAIVALAEPESRPGLLSLALAGAVVLTLVIQLVSGDRKGFVRRVTASAVGAFALLLIASLAGLAVP